MESNTVSENSGDYHWKMKLEDAGSLSEELLSDKNATWQKLHSRLGKKQRRIKIKWYRAAACLLLAALSPVIIKKGTDATFQKKINLQANVTEVKVSGNLPAAKKEKIPVYSFKKLPVISRPSVQSEKKAATAKDLVNKHQPAPPSPIHYDEPVQQQRTTFPLPVKDSVGVVAYTTLPEKKKWNVIHINELDPTVEVIHIASHSKRRPFQIKLINQEAYTNSLPSPTAGKLSFFKQINIPSN